MCNGWSVCCALRPKPCRKPYRCFGSFVEKLLDAQAHPEAYRGLIVRVWGWSGYFVELDKEYQDHIISRAELVM